MDPEPAVASGHLSRDRFTSVGQGRCASEQVMRFSRGPGRAEPRPVTGPVPGEQARGPQLVGPGGWLQGQGESQVLGDVLGRAVM